MKFGGKLKHRQTQYTVSVITQNGTGTEVSALTGLKATRQQSDSVEVVTAAGVMTTVTYRFLFYPDSNNDLPAITENQILSDGTTRFEILQVMGLDYLGRLPVTTVKIR